MNLLRTASVAFLLTASLGAASPAQAAAASASARPDDAAVRLSRAAFERTRGDAAAVIAQLEPLDFSAPSFDGAGRAAFLLAQAYQETGDVSRLSSLARAVAAWPNPDGFARLVATLDAASPVAASGREAADAEALRRAASSLASRDTAAAEAALATIAADGRYAARAAHLRALMALERGESGVARTLLASLANDSPYSGRREARAALASLALDRGDWTAALRHAESAESDWNAQLARLGGAEPEALWSAWATRADTSQVTVVDEVRARLAALHAAQRAANLLTAEAPAFESPAGGMPSGLSPIALAPTPEQWSAVARAAASRDSARASAARLHRAADAEAARLADQRRYLGTGRDSLARLDARLRPAQSRLDALRTDLDGLQERLRAVCDQEKARLAARTAALRASAQQQELWARAMQRLHVSGPDSAFWRSAPAGESSPAGLLERERRLSVRLDSLSSRIAGRAPEWLDRSLDRMWGPRIVDRIVAQSLAARRDRVWAGAISRSLDSSFAAAASSREGEALLAAARAADVGAQGYEARLTDERTRVAKDAVARTRLALEREREGLDYLHAAALYALAVQLDAADTALTAARALPGAASPAVDDAETGDPARRAEALPVLRAFLARHPGSPARGEMRFRLADLELLEARREFRARMAAFLRAQEAGGRVPPVPVIEPGAALALYERMLAEDRDFEHLDAVRFNAGMILAESGSPAAATHFRDLLALSPGSAYAQEAALRLGDMAFQDRRWAEAAPLYARAATGADATLAAIAHYKLGWAAYNEDRFEGAAKSFGAVLDLYATRRADVHVDVETEAESYFVLSLAASGGAEAFARHFASSGPRAYEHRMMLALGQQLRRNGDLSGAARADALVLEREPRHADALLAAERQIATLQRAGDAAELERARQALAPRFVPGSEWSRAQERDSLRTEGERFARATWTALAHDRHERAARTKASADWALARESYEVLLKTWPDDASSPALRLDAARVQAQLGDAPAALRSCALVAKAAPDTLASQALALAVVTADAWYERERGGRAAGPDSLAAVVREAGDALLDRFPSHAMRADVRWRQAQIALAHGDDERAVRALGALLAKDASDTRAPQGALQAADAELRRGRFVEADSAYARAARIARGAGREELARKAAVAQTACAFRAAEAEVARDSSAYENHARAFEAAARRWPAHADADAARYRAALAWERAGKPEQSARVLEAFVAERPNAELSRDARLLVARQYETLRDTARVANAYLAFAKVERDDASASAARLRAADAYEATGRVATADSLRLDHVRRHPSDVDGAFAVYEALARRDLDAVAAGRPLATFLAEPKAARGAKPTRSHLAEYLRLGRAHPKLVSRDVIARMRFLYAEESRVAASKVALTQPLARSVAARKTLLDTTLARYRRCTDAGVPEWAHASAYRIGETLQEFAHALETSEAPADLAGDDLVSYREVLADKARPFAVRGLDVWSELARQPVEGATADAWVARAKDALSERLADRFRFRPEPAFPSFDDDRSRSHGEGVSR